ncbi:MAG: ParB/Srx family N-terminal domain-containing protein [Treponemataceae bacterium]|nr:ParB/Srx family N-terminal domain-containing protein [Treponemataceae bacterium]
MARTLNIITNGSRGGLPVQNQGLKLSKIIAVEKIEEHERFRELYTIDEGLLSRIAEDMKANKFDASQPVHIWTASDGDGTEHFYLIDGYTRLKAARLAGLPTVPYFEHHFGSFEEAHRYALHLQVDRRNLSGIDLLRNIEELMGSDYIKNLKGNRNDAVGELIGTSGKTVERANFVERNATEEQLAEIEAGTATVNSTYNDIKRRQFVERNATDEQKERLDSGEATAGEIYGELKASGRQKKNGKKSGGDPCGEDISDSLSDTSGNPSALNFSHSDGIERPKREPWAEDESDRRLIERYREGKKDGFLEGFSKGAYAVYEKIFEFLDSGRTADEVRNDPLFEDFSPTVIAGKFNEENLYDE